MSALISHPEKKSIKEQIEIFSTVGFESFFLSCGVTNEFEKIPFWKNVADSVGIQFEAVHAPSDNVDSVWLCEKTIDYEKQTKGILDLCSIAGVSKLVLHVGTNPEIKVTDRGLDFWRNLEEYAKTLGVKLCYENANTPILFEAVVNSMDNFHGVCHDIGHQLCYTPKKNYLEMFGDKILYTHIHDNYADGHDMHLLPKDGYNDWELYFNYLLKTGYSGTLNLELSCYYSDEYKNISFENFAKLAFERLSQFTK